MIAQLDIDYIKIRPLKVIPRLISYSLFEGRPLTTSGRWINPVVFRLFNLEKKLPQFKKVNKPIFILGTGRSGTTLLGMLMSMHKSVGFLNEPKALWHSIFPLEDIIGSYSKDEGHYRLDEKFISDKIKISSHKIFGFYLFVTGSKRLVDKYPELIFRTDFVRSIFPDAKFLFLVRNGWDTCASIENWSKVHGINQSEETEDWWGLNNRKWNLLLKEMVLNNPEFNYEDVRTINDHKNMAALEWIVTMQEGLKLMKERKNEIHMVRFEDLSMKRDSSLRSILDFCDLEHDEKFFKYAECTVKSVPGKNKFKLHPSIASQFQQTMNLLDYNG